ncbi:L-threonine ammonia-lyase [Thermoflexibacter ruber]|uniref:L-threonine dehydratase n=2 Tax=Thermoflexibacter ruber TaxID=1003 RepID=A0A1I2E947_9BACT|nr:L-threonine ammonia-lyase [Thermoflexibacter ruber]
MVSQLNLSEFNMDVATLTTAKLPSAANIINAHKDLKNVVVRTLLQFNHNLSEKYQAEIWLKREDLQVVRSYKLRGAYNKITGLKKEELERGVVCASAGNHAQGLAFCCNLLKIKGTIFMPNPTPQQKIKQVKMFGKSFVNVVLTGDTFDDAYNEAIKFCEANNSVFVHPFDDEKVIEGQGTVGVEILEDAREQIDYMFIPVGGGGLSAGVGAYFKQLSPETKIIGVEPEGAPAMLRALELGEVITLDKINKFVDGAAVKRVGNRTFEICRQILSGITLVPEGKVCTTILQLYNEDAIVVEPAGALSIAALDFHKEEIKGKTVVCIVSGSNNDITRMEEIKERSMLYEGLKHYFIINFPQRSGALREFLNDVLGPNDDITHFEYTKKNNRERGPALIGIEVNTKEDYEGLLARMNERKIVFQHINERPDLFSLLI